MQTESDLCVLLMLGFSRAHPRRQLSDVATGLCYLHSRNIMHGDLQGVCGCSISFSVILTPGQVNIFVDGSGHARIADFGHAMVTPDLDSTQSAPCQRGHTLQWAAPEVSNEGTCSKEGDVFSFAIVTIEVHHG